MSNFLEGFRERQLQAQEFIAAQDVQQTAYAFTYVLQNVTFNFETAVIPTLEGLSTGRDPDFYLIEIVRFLFATAEYDDIILPYLLEIPLWLTQGDITRVYWSENHMIMFLSCHFLLKEKFGDIFTPINDRFLNQRLLWWLRAKTQQGFYEYHSLVYMRYTTAAILNLVDFAQDEEVQIAANDALNQVLTEILYIRNTRNRVLGASGRVNMPRFSEDRLLIETERGLSLMMFGGDDWNEFFDYNDWEFAAHAMAFSEKFDPTDLVNNFNEVDYIVRKIGHDDEEGAQLRRNLTLPRDKTIARMSTGGYAHPDYVRATLSLVDDFDLWEHWLFQSYAFMQFAPKLLWSPLTNAVATLTEGSLAFVPRHHIWKHHGSSLSSVENYYPGFKGYQQAPWVAGVEVTGVYTMSVDANSLTSFNDINFDRMNNQLPFINQTENVALIMYNPHKDLGLLGVREREVVFFFERTSYDEIVEEENWIFGKSSESYIGVYRHCVADTFGSFNTMSACFDDQQTWAVVVGNNYTHDDFASFSSLIVSESSIVTSFEDVCTFAAIEIDGKTMSHEFCRDIGNMTKTVLIVVAAIFAGILYAIYRCIIMERERRQKGNETESSIDESEIMNMMQPRVISV